MVRVSEWMADDAGPGWAVRDDRGDTRGRVYAADSAWGWWAHRPFADAACGKDCKTADEAKAAARAVLDTWTEVVTADDQEAAAHLAKVRADAGALRQGIAEAGTRARALLAAAPVEPGNLTAWEELEQAMHSLGAGEWTMTVITAAVDAWKRHLTAREAEPMVPALPAAVVDRIAARAVALGAASGAAVRSALAEVLGQAPPLTDERAREVAADNGSPEDEAHEHTTEACLLLLDALDERARRFAWAAGEQVTREHRARALLPLVRAVSASRPAPPPSEDERAHSERWADRLAQEKGYSLAEQPESEREAEIAAMLPLVREARQREAFQRAEAEASARATAAIQAAFTAIGFPRQDGEPLTETFERAWKWCVDHAHKAQEAAERATAAPLTEAGRREAATATPCNDCEGTGVDEADDDGESENEMPCQTCAGTGTFAANRGAIPPEVRPQWPVCVDCVTEPGMPRTEVVAASGTCARCGNGGIMYAPPTSKPTLAPGMRVRTSYTARGMAMFPGSALRRDNAPGEVRERVADTWTETRIWLVRHDDGTKAPYDADELTVIKGSKS